MTKRELIEAIKDMPDDAEVRTEFGDVGVGGNVSSAINSVAEFGNVFLDDKGKQCTDCGHGIITLVTDHCC